ncbi:MAG: carboxypeptidase-like regulatory domain-containing protein [Bacteroidota bacterium]|nr:carboxypeptidase-like regulatory domain-containing protein [Bacteroidota bacterium]
MYKIFKIGLFFIFYFITLLSYSKGVVIKGIVFDEKENSPLANTSVKVVNSYEGTLTNYDGEFKLILDSFPLPVKLIFSRLSYKSDTFVILSEIENIIIKLTPLPIVLAEVNVKYIDPFKILLQVSKKLYKYNNSHFYSKVFYKQTTLYDSLPVQYLELIFSAKTNNGKIEGSYIENGRYAQRKDGPFVQDFSKLIRGHREFDKKNPGIYDPKNHKDYEILSTSFIDDKIMSIKFKYKPTNANREIKIDTINKLLIESSSEFETNIVQQMKDYEVLNQKMKLISKFKSINDNISSYEYVEINFTMDLGKINEPKRKVLISSIAYFYNTTSELIKSVKYSKALNSDNNDKELIDKMKYDSSLWIDNPIIKRTQKEELIIQGFEKSKSFDTMIKE